MKTLSGIKTDFDQLLKQFKACDSVRFEHFAEQWKNLKMSYILSGIDTTFEMRQFVEYCLKLALDYCNPEREFQDRMGGLYLLYSLYYKQPIDPPARIRVLANQWNDLKILLEEIKAQQHLDSEYIITKLKADHAFQLVASSSRETLTRPKQDKTEEDTLGPDKSNSAEQEPSILSDVMQPDTIGQLSALHEQYHRMKCYLAGKDSSKPDASLSCINNNLVQTITKSVASFEEYRKRKLDPRKVRVRRRKDSGTTTTSESEGDSDFEAWRPTKKKVSKHGELRASLKEKAFSMPVGDRFSSLRKRNGPTLEKTDHAKSSNVSDSGADDSDVMLSPDNKQSDSDDEEEHLPKKGSLRGIARTSDGDEDKGTKLENVSKHSPKKSSKPSPRKGFGRGARVRGRGVRTRGSVRMRGGLSGT